MESDWEWWAGNNDENYQIGPCASRDEALEEACDYFGDDADTIFLIEATRAQWWSPRASTVIDELLNNCDDLFADDWPDLCGTKERRAEAEGELQSALDVWMNKWRDEIFPTPTRFASTRNSEAVSVASADTHPKGGDVKQAPLVSGAVPDRADAQTQPPSPRSAASVQQTAAKNHGD